jgi:hypothetical protein
VFEALIHRYAASGAGKYGDADDQPLNVEDLPRADARLVTTWTSLRRRGISRAYIQAQLSARRWQRLGFAIALHNGPMSQRQRWMVACMPGRRRS